MPAADIALLIVFLAVIGGVMHGVTRLATGFRFVPPDLRRLLAAPPLAVYGAFSGMLVFGLMGDPTAANLWPLAVAILCALWVLYALVLAVVLGLFGLYLRRA